MTLKKISDRDMRHCHFLKSTCDIGNPPTKAREGPWFASLAAIVVPRKRSGRPAGNWVCVAGDEGSGRGRGEGPSCPNIWRGVLSRSAVKQDPGRRHTRSERWSMFAGRPLHTTHHLQTRWPPPVSQHLAAQNPEILASRGSDLSPDIIIAKIHLFKYQERFTSKVFSVYASLAVEII